MSANPDIKQFNADLARDMKAAVTAKSTAAVAALEERRHQLLSRHLGFEPRRPIEPVFVLGDSHTLFFSGDDSFHQIRHRRVGFWRPRYIMRGLDLLPCFRTRHLGPATAWRAFDYGSSTRAREKIDVLLRRELKPGDRVLLSFGEIDCRCHIPKTVMAGTPITDAVLLTIERLFKLTRHLGARDLQVAIWGPAMVATMPTDVAGHPLEAVGPLELRQEITRAFCEQLRQVGSTEEIPCVSLFGTFHKWNEPAPPESFCDGFHLSQQMMPRALRALLDTGVLTLQNADTTMPSAHSKTS